MLLALSACGDGSEEARRFANEPVPTFAQSTATLAATNPSTPPTAAPVVSPGALLATRGAPERLFFTAVNELWTIGADGADPQPLLQPKDTEGEIRAIAQAPGVAGDKVAALLSTETDNGETVSLVLLDGTGAEIRRIDRLEEVLGPDAEATVTARSLTWSPQGNQLLATFVSGGIVGVPLEGDPTLVVAPEAAPDPAAAAWSPAGDAIAFLAATAATDVHQLIVAPIGADGVDPATFMVASSAADAVGDFAWLPDGSGLIYSEAGTLGSSRSGDLFTVQADGDDRRLVASAGRAAPVARIVDFAISPDGGSIAYTIATPDGDGGRLVFHSLWVRSLDSAATVPVPVGDGERVTDLWWTATGLVWKSEPVGSEDSSQDGGFALARLDRDSAFSLLFEVTPAATPQASPGAALEGSPNASPGATAEASPVAPDEAAAGDA